MTSYTYTTLTNGIIAWFENDDAEFAASVPDMIALAETKVVRDLALSNFDQEATASCVGGTATVTKPTGAINTWELGYMDGSGKYQHLEPRDWAYLKTYWPDATATGTPKYFNEYTDTQWFLAPTPSTNLTLRGMLLIRPTGLSSGNQNTFVSNRFGDLLFAACLIEAERFAVADTRLPTWKTMYEQELLPVAKAEVREMVRARYIIPRDAP